MSQVILKERTAHLGSCTYRWLLVNIATFLRTVFFYRTPPEAVICRYSSK